MNLFLLCIVYSVSNDIYIVLIMSSQPTVVAVVYEWERRVHGGAKFSTSSAMDY